jgi:cobalt/nickel transport system permease protein
MAAGIPLRLALVRAGLVFSFALPFALLSFLAGEPGRAGALLAKSYLSSLAVLLVVSTTPMTVLLRGLEAVGAPRFLLMVAQFVYRYLFVIAEEAQQLRAAAAARGATVRGTLARRARFQAAAGALGALFARSYARAEAVHRAMLARGFAACFTGLDQLQFRRADAYFALLAGCVPVAARLAVERLA